MRVIAICVALAISGVANAQTTNCQWFGSIWSCSTPQPVRPSGPDWRLLQPQNNPNQIYDAYEQGLRARQQQNAIRAQEQREADYRQCRQQMQAAVSARDFDAARFYASLCP